jgi:hypothetical protein
LRSIIAPYAWGGGIPLESKGLARLSQNLFPEGTLRVRRVVYSSPGSTDLAGIGVIIGHITDTINKFIDFWSERETRKIENDILRAKLAQIRIENAQKLVAIAKDCGFSEPELRQMIIFVDVSQEVIVKSIEDGRLRAAQLLEDCDRY